MSHSNKETSKPACSDHSDSNDSEWGLQIVIKSTPKKRKKKLIDPKDKAIIDEFEKDIEDTLEEKAAKSNLSHTTVKSILKHVFTDEHVLALVKQKEGCEDVESIIPYEPKITRSKAKELYPNAGSVISLPWQTPPAASEVQALLAQDLQEDSSGDEYVPGQEESEDEISFSISNPPTPASQGTPSRQCIDEVDAEVFKTPQRNQKKYRKKTEKANIALRTRSKFCLSETPLEKIEQDFIPPDITTDMYEMNCNDEEWKEFLKSFTQPLEEVVKATEDEEHDPEYNFLSDEEIETVDKEELRADKAVKVPRKELNDLMAELFEYVDIYSKKSEKEKLECEISSDSTNQIQQELFDSCIEIFNGNSSPNPLSDDNQGLQDCLHNTFTQSQLLLLHQQMRQHVQMLTQNFLLTYHHPFYDHFSTTFKEYLLNFKFLSSGKQCSVFNCSNLEYSLELVNSWEKLFENNDDKAIETIKQFTEVMEQSVQLHLKQEYYYLPFPQLILKTIADSDIFIYPHLLPVIPFKHPEILKNDVMPFSYSEYQLIALGLEQFVPYFMNIKEFMTRKKEINFKKMAQLIHQFIIPARQPSQIYRQISEKKQKKYLPNPIAYYNMHKKAPLTIHQVNPFIISETIPPRKRPPMLLPIQWRNYIWPDWRMNKDVKEEHFPKPTLMLNEPKKLEPPKPLVKLLPKESFPVEKSKNESLSKERLINSRDHVLKNKFINCFQSKISYFGYRALSEKNDYSNNFTSEKNKKEDSITEEDTKFSSEIKILKMNNMPRLDLSDGSNINISHEDVKHNTRIDNLLVVEKKNCVVEGNNVYGEKKISEKKDLSSLINQKNIERKTEYFSSLATISPPELTSEKTKRVQFATTYFKKLKKTLRKTDFMKVDSLFKNFHKKKFNAMDFYTRLSPLLNLKYQSLVHELRLFLDLELANALGKLIPFFLTNHMDKFKRCFEVYFKEEPLLWRKIDECFLGVNTKASITLDKFKKTILPHLRKHPLLCYTILEIFLKETTPSSILNSTWEINDIITENGKFSDSIATELCSCDCHKVIEQGSLHECLNCGLRFVDDRIYCHSSKGFKLINITFPFDPNIDGDKSLGNEINSEKVIQSLSTTLNSDCEKPLETFEKKIKKRVRKKLKKKQMLRINILKKSKMKSKCKDISTVHCVEHEPFSEDLSQKNSEVNSSLNQRIVNANGWTREEDKIILQMFQEKLEKDAIHSIQKELKNRSVTDITTRFEELMVLMQELEG